MARTLALLYGVVSYAAFLLTFLYAIGFVGCVVVPKCVNEGPATPVGTAIAINVMLLGLFAAQHSIMARRSFKRLWTRFVPWAVERSTYVLAASIVLALLLWQWRPLPGVVWDVELRVARTGLWALFWLGWAIVFLSTYMINHFDLFGLRQVWLYFRRREYAPVGMKTTGFYRYVRNPLMLGFIIAFWAAPTMTLSRLFFAAAATGYILLGIYLEERDHAHDLGEPYRAYKASTPMLLPLPRRKSG